MVNYFGMVYEDPSDSYGTNVFQQNRLPEFYINDNGHSPDLNVQDFDEEDVHNGLTEFRNGYFEPEGELSLSADVRSVPTYLYGLMGLYKFTENGETLTDGETTLNVHEFWIGDKLERPAWAADFTSSDLLLSRVFGGLFDSMEWNGGLGKTTVDLKYIFKTMHDKNISLESYRSNFTTLKTIPIVGYDYTVQIGNPSDGGSGKFKEFTLTVENNHQTGDDARCLGSITYSYKPLMENCNIELEAVTRLDRSNFEFIMGARHNSNTPGASGWYSPKACEEFTKSVMIKARSCVNNTDYIIFTFPKCRITLEPIEADGNVIDVTLKLKPFRTEKVTLLDTTKKITPMYVKVVNSSPRVGPDILE